nr:hypothetical protein L195_g018629 [Ipomoea batatas]
MNEPMQMACMVQQMFHSQKNAKCPYVWIGPVVTRLCHGLGLQGELAREKMIATMQPFSDAHLSRSYARRVGDVPRPPRGEPHQQQEQVVEEGQDVPPEGNMRRMQDKRKGSNNSSKRLRNYACGWSIDSHPLHRGGHEEHTNRQRIGKKHTKQGEIALEIAQYKAGNPCFFRPASSSTPKQNWAEPESFLLDAPLDARPAWRNISTSPLSSVFGSPPPSPKGILRTEMMVPRHTLERGETSRGNHDDSSSEEGEGYNMEYANRGLMLQVEDLFRFRHFRAKEIIEWCFVDTPTLEALGIRREYERIATQPFWRAISDQGQAWYANLVEDFESELQEDLFWWSIARPGVTWRASYTSARYIKVPELLILWHIVARSWLGKRTRNDNITRSELFILWSMYTETPVHMGELCKRILKRQSYEDSENIFIGPFVSRLAEALGFEEVLSQEVVTTTMRPIDMEECVHLGLRFNDTMGVRLEKEKESYGKLFDDSNTE